MSTPMYDAPEHMALPINEYGQGPEEDIARISWWVCWCSDPQCPRFQVSGRDYRDAVERLKERGTPMKKAEFVVQQMIQLGWVIERSKALQEPSQ